jgi:hypothetical protein
MEDARQKAMWREVEGGKSLQDKCRKTITLSHLSSLFSLSQLSVMLFNFPAVFTMRKKTILIPSQRHGFEGFPASPTFLS